MTALGSAFIIYFICTCFQPVISQSANPGLPTSLVVVVAVVGLLLLLLLTAAIVVWCWLCRRMTKPSLSLLMESSSSQIEDLDHSDVEGSDSRERSEDGTKMALSLKRLPAKVVKLSLKSHPVKVEELGEYVSQLHARNCDGISAQYELLPSEEHRHQATLSLKYQSCNRFRNIHVYDDNHIDLQPHDEYVHLQHTYINASYIDGYSAPKKYIATQGPLLNTLVDFWQMVWQEEVYTIAMVTSLQECGKKKCEQYWSDTGSSEYGPFEVTITEQTVMADYVIRKFQLKNHAEGGLVRSVYQVQFTSWPDHGVPGCTGSMLAFYRCVKAQNKASNGPILIHCSAGVGRTGTMIAIDIALEQAAKEGVIDIAAIVSKMRSQRMQMIQTADQLMLVYDAALEDIVCGDTRIPAANLKKALQLLGQQDEELGITGFEKQFQTMKQMSKGPDEISADSAENRNQDFSPDQFGVSFHENYAHTSFVHGYKDLKGFIIAQAPESNTCKDFWKMVCRREVGVIVMLSELEEEGESVCCQYWPESGSENYGEYRVSVTAATGSGGYMERTLGMTGTKNSKCEVVHEVAHFQLGCWTPQGMCTDPQALIAVLDQVCVAQRRCGNKPIVVHGRDTMSRCGVFCALLNTIECSKTEGMVNVFQMVKAMNFQKPGTLATVEQYRFVYDMVAVFLDSFSIYSNFK